MRLAVFESEPQASATAIALRELGFNADVLTRAGTDFDDRARDFFSGNPPPYQPNAILSSSDADQDRFVRVVQRHYGVLAGGNL